MHSVQLTKFKCLSYYQQLGRCLVNLANVDQNRIRSQAELTERLKKKRQLTTKMKTFQMRSARIETSSSEPPKKRMIQQEENSLRELEKKYLKKDVVRIAALASSESSYLSQVSSVQAHTRDLDENARRMLDELSSLKKVSTDPRHLTIVHKQLAQKIAQIILDRATVTSQATKIPSIFAEFQPGFALVTQSLLSQPEAKLFNKFLLLESFSKFDQFLRDVSSSHENVFTIHQKPFDSNFLFSVKPDDKRARYLANLVDKDPSHANGVNMSVFGVLPWNAKGYLTKTLADFASDRALFSLNRLRLVDLYFYVPELVLARIKPDFKKHYSRVVKNSALGVLASLLPSKLEVLDQQTNDYFFPHPVVASPNKFKRLYQRIDPRKLYLITMRLERAEKTDLEEFSSKRLLYLFVSQMFVRPTACLKDALRSVCSNVDMVCKDTLLSPYLPVNSLQPFKFQLIFDYLQRNPEISHLRQLENSSFRRRPKGPPKSKSQILRELETFNKNFSGQFVIEKPSESQPEAHDVYKSSQWAHDHELEDDFDSDFCHENKEFRLIL